MRIESATSSVILARVVDEPLEVAVHLDAVAGPVNGATDVFVGTIRDHDPAAAGRVLRLDYEAHPDAERILGELAARVAGETGATIAVSHRFGSLEVGDIAVVIASSAAHRAQALEATRSLIELVKVDLPIWKRQTDTEGGTGWVGLP